MTATKEDLFHAAWELASLCNDAGSCDDNESTLAKLIETIDARRERKERPKLRLPKVSK